MARMSKGKRILVYIAVGVLALIILIALGANYDRISSIFGEGSQGGDDGKNQTDDEPGKPPLAFLSVDPNRVEVGIPVFFDAGDSYDPDIDPTSNYTGIVNFEWDFGVGSDPISTNLSEQEFTYGEEGEYEVTVVVYDDDGMSDEASVVVTVVHEATNIDSGSQALIGQPIFGILDNSTEERWNVSEGARNMSLEIVINGADIREVQASELEVLLYNPYEQIMKNETVTIIGGRTLDWEFVADEIDIPGEYYIFIHCYKGAALVDISGSVVYL